MASRPEDQVDGAKLGGFGRGRMRDADQVDEGVAGTNQLPVGVGVERVAGDDFACRRAAWPFDPGRTSTRTRCPRSRRIGIRALPM